MTYTHYIYRTRYHGGGIVSRHKTAEAAHKRFDAIRKLTECSCGCVVVIPAQCVSGLPFADEDGLSPYQAARRRGEVQP